jgi:hypothetical protein
MFTFFLRRIAQATSHLSLIQGLNYNLATISPDVLYTSLYSHSQEAHALFFNIFSFYYEINFKLTLTEMVSMVLKPELFYNSRAVKLMEKERNPPQKQDKAEREKPLLA